MKKKRSSQKTSREQKLFLNLGKDRWPLERDVLVRPDRLKYVRKLVKSEGCVFCAASKNQPAVETLCVFQSESSMIVLNKYPYNPGHLLVLPLRHCGELDALSDSENLDLARVLQLAVRALKKAYTPGGLNVGLNLGATAGAGIPEHLHYHVVPRWGGDLNFFPLIAETKVIVEDLATTYQRVLKAIEDLVS